MQKFQIIDNFLDYNEFKVISSILTDQNFPWYYSDYVAHEESRNNYEYYFEHNFYNFWRPSSNYFELLLPILEKLNVKALIRAKANLYPNSGNTLLKNAFHKDQDFTHKGAVFYVNTNDGYTGLEDGTKIKSVENRILLFNSSELHHSTHCTDQKVRININLNYF